jgi:hypothetical protein
MAQATVHLPEEDQVQGAEGVAHADEAQHQRAHHQAEHLFHRRPLL